jgi:multidrug efflux pump subunit AcrA (membrane-fusion protein)
MRIALAQAEQARVKLELTRYRLAQAALVAPFDGVVIEGDLRERIGAPVRQGDTLLRVARLDALDIEIELDQRDAHEVRSGAKVRLAFAGRPGFRVKAVVEMVEPQAQNRERRNYFPARCALVDPPAEWMRPGMTGLGKVSAGWHSSAWIVMRRTTDFIRLHVWW